MFKNLGIRRAARNILKWLTYMFWVSCSPHETKRQETNKQHLCRINLLTCKFKNDHTHNDPLLHRRKLYANLSEMVKLDCFIY